MRILHRIYFSIPNKRFVLKLVRKFSSVVVFIPVLLISLFLIADFSSIACGAEIHLTPQEQDWLRKHPDIKLGAPMSYPPLVIKNTKGTHTGMLVDLFDLISQRLNTNIGLHFEDSWKSIQEKAKNRNIDGLATGGRSTSREEYLNSTDTLYSTYHYIFARTGDQLHIKSVKDLEGMRIGYKSADVPVKSLIDKYIGVKPIPYNDNAAMTKGLMNREVDVLVAWISYDFWRRDKLQGSVDNILLASDSPLDMYIHIRKDWPELIPLLNKALSSIRQNELPKIMDKWFIERPQSSEIPKTNLTKKEQDWLRKKRTIRVRITDYPPFCIPNKDDEPTGIAIDYLNLIAEKTGVELKYYSSNKTFYQTLNGLIKHQGPDIMPMLVSTPDREKSIIFTNEYFNSPYMFFTRTDDKQIITHIDDLMGKKIALLRGSTPHRMMEKKYPDFELMLYDNDIDAIEAVASKKADAYMGNLMMTSYLILSRGTYNLKIAAPSPFDNQRFSMGIRNDWPELASIIEKGLAAITIQEQDEIRNRYISIHYKQLNTAAIVKWALVTGFIISGIIVLFFFWNRSLANKVKDRTLSLENSKKTLESEIVDRKKTESTLMEMSLQQKELIKASNVGLWDWNLQTNEVQFSEEWKNQIGYSHDDFPNDFKEWESRVHPEDLKSTIDAVERSIQEINKNHQAEFRFKHRNGSYIWIWAHASVFENEKGEAVRMVGSHIDITEQKRAEKDKTILESKLQQAQKMETIGQLAGGIAHDFNNILYPILGFTQMVKDELPKTHKVQDDLDDILDGAKRARDLVKRILLFSRQKEQILEPLILRPVIEETLKLIRSSIPANINIQHDFYNGEDYVLCDPTGIHEIVMNLCTNAYHAIEGDEGLLKIGLTKAKPPENFNLPSGNYICLSVGDNGFGIPIDKIDKIFEPYFTTKDIGKGTGLGLSVVHGIVKDYQGDIQVVSNPGEGTIFNVFLPITSQTNDYLQQQSLQSLGGNERILFIDDEPSIMKLGVRILEKKGYNVTGIQLPSDALSLFSSKPNDFDLIITDMAMPGMVGSHLAKKVLDIRADIPIIICTGYSEKLDTLERKSLNIKAFIDKPILVEDLISKVREVLDQK